MRFFTPELYVRFNSADDDVAEQANGEWELALSQYRAHLDGMHDQMPSSVKMLSGLCLHDADFLACEQKVEPFYSLPIEPFVVPAAWTAMAIVSVKQDDHFTSLIYRLWDHVREFTAIDDWPFSKVRTHWLYDEIDKVADHPGEFLHRVMLSDGRVLEIPFVSAVIHSVPLPRPVEGREVRQIA